MERPREKAKLDTAPIQGSLPDVASTHPGILLAEASV